MPSKSLGLRDSRLIRLRAATLMGTMFDAANAAHAPPGLHQMLETAALGSLKPHVDALEASNLRHLLARRTELYFNMRLWSTDETPLSRNPVVLRIRAVSPLAFYAGGSQASGCEPIVLSDSDEVPGVRAIRRWLRQMFRVYIETEIVKITVAKVVHECSTTGQMLRYMPALLQMPMTDDYQDRAYGRKLFEKSEASGDPSGSRIRPELDAWGGCIEVAGNLIAQAAMIPARPADADRGRVVPAFVNATIELPGCKIFPEGLVLPPHEDPPA